jgi:hypothetical protein
MVKAQDAGGPPLNPPIPSSVQLVMVCNPDAVGLDAVSSCEDALTHEHAGTVDLPLRAYEGYDGLLKLLRAWVDHWRRGRAGEAG